MQKKKHLIVTITISILIIILALLLGVYIFYDMYGTSYVDLSKLPANPLEFVQDMAYIVYAPIQSIFAPLASFTVIIGGFVLIGIIVAINSLVNISTESKNKDKDEDDKIEKI